MIRSVLAAALLLAAPPLLAQEAPAAPPVEQPPEQAQPAAPQYRTVRVKLDTAEGPIVFELEAERAPITTANFLKYVDQKRLDGTSFYRAYNIPGHPGLGLIQGGAKSDPKRMLPAIQHEPTTKTGLSHKEGAISMARDGPDTATSSFFIVTHDTPALDFGGGRNPDGQGFAAFGRLVEGLDVARRIQMSPANTQERLTPPVVIRSARIEGHVPPACHP